MKVGNDLIGNLPAVRGPKRSQRLDLIIVSSIQSVLKKQHTFGFFLNMLFESIDALDPDHLIPRSVCFSGVLRLLIVIGV